MNILDLQSYMDKMSEVRRKVRRNYHLTKGELIEKLGECEKNKIIASSYKPYNDEMINVYISGRLFSYRGYYSDMILEYTRNRDEATTVEDLLRHLRNFDEMTGYKGGDFKVEDDTVVWLDAYGEAQGNAVMDLFETGELVLLFTKVIE